MVALFTGYCAFAQGVKKVEGEISLGTGVALNKEGADNLGIITSARGELRFNHPSGKYDFGVGARTSAFYRNYGEFSPLYASVQVYLAADRNWMLSKNFMLFGGLEAGASYAIDCSEYNKTRKYGGGYNIQYTSLPDHYQGKTLSPYVAPRVGFEAWNHIRGSLSLGLTDAGYSSVNLSVGFTF